MAELMWFHAFRRTIGGGRTDPPDIEAILRVLHDGPQVHPSETNETRQHELRLRIQPHRVYAYLGRTLDAFGDNAVVLPQKSIQAGHVSPFDTGGLINKLAPINGCEDDAKADFLASFTWTIADLPARLDEYPSRAPDALERYLDPDHKPAGIGPCVVWADRPSVPLWKSNDHWRAWTWEGRAEPQHVAIAELHHWTCAASVERQILKAAKRVYRSEKDFVIRLQRTWVEGGVSPLVAKLRRAQAA